jgi:hypothetical protein
MKDFIGVFMATMQFRSAFPAIVISLYLPSLWCQQATLTGIIRDHKTNKPLDGAGVIIANSTKTATSNSEGEYRVSGLPLGGKVMAVYKMDGYGARLEEITLTKQNTEHDEPLYQDLVLVSDWDGVTRTLAASSAKDPATRRSGFWAAWKEVDDSSLSPEAKAAAAHSFLKVLGPGLAGATDPDSASSLRAYSTIDRSRISDAKADFQTAITGTGTLRGKNALVPGNVAADIAAQQINEQGSPEVPKDFLGDFRVVYGAKAASALVDKAAIGKMTN